MKDPPASVVSNDSGAFLICGLSKLSSVIEEADELPDSTDGIGCCCCCCVFSGVLILLLGPDDIIIFGLNTIAGEGLSGGVPRGVPGLKNVGAGATVR